MLNPEQKRVAQSRARRTMVEAGAGTGKTKAATSWVAGLLEEGIPGESIMMITFTRKAAAEMKHRVKQLAGSLADTVICGTYHHVALRMIRRNPEAFGYSGAMTILDDPDCKLLVKEAYKSLGIKSPEISAAEIISAISSARNRDVDIGNFLRSRYSDETRVVDVAKIYLEQKKENHLLDYDDILISLRDRLVASPSYATSVRNRFTHLLVDEMQDNNIVQYQILQAINPHHLMVVGDINQSIYGFRAAEPGLMIRFIEENADAEKIRLETNYRSGNRILELANRIIADGPSPLVLKSGTGRDARVEIREYQDVMEEAGIIAGKIEDLIEAGQQPATIGVLARSSRTLAPLEINLRRSGIEYRKYGGISVADALEVRDFTSFVRVMANPLDKPSWMRVLTQFPGVGVTSARKAIESTFVLDALPKKAAVLKDWMREAESLPFHEGLRSLMGNVRTMMWENYEDNNAQSRMDNLERLVESCISEDFTREDFVDAFVTEKMEEKHPELAITLSTIHSAKGLEWETVFLVGAGDTQMPGRRAIERHEIEEERRLMYVAVTRAKGNLGISFPGVLGEGWYGGDAQGVSRFLQ